MNCVIIKLEEYIMNTNKFDKSRFAALLIKAVGTQTQKKFATDCGLSPEHLSRMINQKITSPPSLNSLEKIANYAQNQVQLNDLLFACGYDTNGDKKRMTSAIVTFLQSVPQIWNLTYSQNLNFLNFFDFTIQFTEMPIYNWYFHLLENIVPSQIETQYKQNLIALLYLPLNENDKCSFVTWNKEEYQYYIDFKPKNLSLNLSILLIDETSLHIIEETNLHQQKKEEF